MKCFCDINLHRINRHLDWYGYYGLAFSKEWGMRNGIQPIQYINPDSALRKDFSFLFSKAMQSEDSQSNELENQLKSFMLCCCLYDSQLGGVRGGPQNFWATFRSIV